MAGYKDLLRTPGVARIIIAQLVARFPNGMTSLAILMHVEQITGYYPAAVKIFNQCHRVTCRDNLVLDQPSSNGIWYDVGNRDGVFVDNWIEGALDGFFFEISRGAVCAGNVFVNCDKGVRVLNSADVQVYHNTFVNTVASFERDLRSAVHSLFDDDLRTRLAGHARDSVSDRPWSIAITDLLDRHLPALV